MAKRTLADLSQEELDMLGNNIEYRFSEKGIQEEYEKLLAESDSIQNHILSSVYQVDEYSTNLIKIFKEKDSQLEYIQVQSGLPISTGDTIRVTWNYYPAAIDPREYNTPQKRVAQIEKEIENEFEGKMPHEELKILGHLKPELKKVESANRVEVLVIDKFSTVFESGIEINNYTAHKRTDFKHKEVYHPIPKKVWFI